MLDILKSFSLLLAIILYFIENVVVIDGIFNGKLGNPLHFYLFEVIAKSLELLLKLIQKRDV